MISPLDMLALAAENMELKRKMAEQLLENSALKEELSTKTKSMAQQVLENENLRRKITTKKPSYNTKFDDNVQKKCHFNVESVRDSPVRENFKFHTGFTYEQFMNIYKFLVPYSGESPINFPKTISSQKTIRLQDQLLLTLVKLRLNFEFKHIANLFQISPQDAGALFRGWINYMYYRFGSVSIWPDREIIQMQMPEKFKADFPTTIVILDGTELKVERPSSMRSQSQCYSDYKSATTLKGLVGIDPRGSFTFISMLFSGSISDKEITKQSGLLKLLKQLLDSGKLKSGDGVMVDKGFLIREEIEELGLKLYIPPFAPGAGQMSAGDVKLTKKIAAHRVHVERAISRAKKFKIVDNRIDLSLFPCINQIWFCCCFLTGFMPFLIQE
jgi:hypothetical protein